MQAVRLTSTFYQVQHFLDSLLDLTCLLYSLKNLLTRPRPVDFDMGALSLIVVLQWTSARLISFETGSDNVFLVIRPLNHRAHMTHFAIPIGRRRLGFDVVGGSAVFAHP